MEFAVEKALEMFRETPALVDDAREGTKVNNSIAGAWVAAACSMPRQYAEAAVRDALDVIDKQAQE